MTGLGASLGGLAPSREITPVGNGWVPSPRQPRAAVRAEPRLELRGAQRPGWLLGHSESPAGQPCRVACRPRSLSRLQRAPA